MSTKTTNLSVTVPVGYLASLSAQRMAIAGTRNKVNSSVLMRKLALIRIALNSGSGISNRLLITG